MNDQKTEICKVCKKEKSLEEFPTYKSARLKRQVRRHQCNDCERRRAREYWNKHPEQRRKNKLHFYYGISVDDYASLLLKQKGVCAICGNPETRIMYGKVTTLIVDHNHKTGENRGLLCHKCNLTLGTAGDDISVLESAIRYLTFWLNE